MMKPNLSIATGLRRLSSEQLGENPFASGNISPQGKTSQYLKSSYGDFQGKKQLSSSLKGLLSPVDYKLVEMQTKTNVLKLEEETTKPSPKGSARLSGHMGLNGNEPSNEIYSKGPLHQKKSFDSKIDSQYEDTLGSKTKLPNTNSLSHTRSQTSSNIYLKDVEYVVNPMFSPVNGPPKYISHRQSDSLGDAISPKGGHIKKGSGVPDGKMSQKQQENQDLILKKESHSTKAMPKASLNQFFDAKKGSVDQKRDEGSSDEFQAGSRGKSNKEKNTQIPFNKTKDSKKSPSMNISPRVEAYNSLQSYGGSNSIKDFDGVQSVKNKSTIGSLYSRQREENQELAKTASISKSSPKKSVGKGVKKDSFFPKSSKQAEAINVQNKGKKEIYMKEDVEDIQVRPRTAKLSEPNIQKDINSSIFSAFNNQSKRNSAAQIYNPSNLVESNLQSTRSAVDRSEKQYYSKGDDQRNAKGTNPMSAEIDYKLTSEEIEDVYALSKKGSLSQLTNNPNAKFLLLRKQVQDKRANRGFKSAGQDIFDLHYYPENFQEKKELPSSSTKQGSDIQYYLPDTTHTSAKLPGQNQLNDIFFRVNKILNTYQKKEKTWEEERRILLAEIQTLRAGKQLK